MLLILHGVRRHLRAHIRHAGRVDGALYQVCLGYEVRVLTGHILACFHSRVGVRQGLGDGNVVFRHSRVFERIHRILHFNIGYDGRHHALHQYHLGHHAPAHLAGSHDTRPDDPAFFLSFDEFLIHVQHCMYLLFSL